MFAESIFPTDSITSVTSGITNAISNNILAVLGILAFLVGVKIVLKSLSRGLNDNVGYLKSHKSDGKWPQGRF